MTQNSVYLYRQQLTLNPGQGVGRFSFDTGIETEFCLGRTYCYYTYTETANSMRKPLEPVEISILDAQGAEVVYHRLSEWASDILDHKNATLNGVGEIVVINPNIGNGCGLDISLFVELTPVAEAEEMIMEMSEDTEGFENSENSEDSWNDYVRRQQERRKQALGVVEKEPSLLKKLTWLQLFLIGCCITFSQIPLYHFELLLCTMIL